MKRWISILWLMLVVVLSFGCYMAKAQGTEDLELVTYFYVGEFKKNSAKLNGKMFDQITTGIEKLPKSLKVSARIKIYTDSSGTEEVNIDMAKKRFLALEAALGDLLLDVAFIPSQIYTYQSGKNNANRRFAIVEFWAPITDVVNNVEMTKLVVDLKEQSSEQLKQLLNEIGIDVKAQGDKVEDIGFQVRDLSVAVEHFVKEQVQDNADTSAAISNLEKNIQVSNTGIKKITLLLIFLTVGSILTVFVANLILSSRQERRLTLVSEKHHQQTVKALSAPQPIKGKPIDKEVEVKMNINNQNYMIICKHIREEDGTEYWETPFEFSSSDKITGKKRSKLEGNVKHFAKDRLDEQVVKLLKDGMMKRI